MTYDHWKATNPADAELGNTHADHNAIVTRYWAKPIPLRQFDWEATYDGDEPNDAGGMAVGHGRTEAEAIADLLANFPREEDSRMPGWERRFWSLLSPETARRLKAEQARKELSCRISSRSVMVCPANSWPSSTSS